MGMEANTFAYLATEGLRFQMQKLQYGESELANLR